MPELSPWYIIPVLVKQPTWGGHYIAEFKSLTDAELTHENIGQSFELQGASWVTPAVSSGKIYGLATASTANNPEWKGEMSMAFRLADQISTNPEGILGKKVISKDGPYLKTLIKFTQAQNNSYQAHVVPGKEFGKWQAKPESWYFLEPGKATLGLAPNSDVAEYQARSEAIDSYAQEVSQKITQKTMSLEEGRAALKAFIDQDHPRRFVNTVSIQANQTVDLSQGGIHHSWEKDESLPHGNIVYEVQVDVSDDVCTLRSFDQGSIKDDGSVRPLSIPDYFTALDTDPAHNLPDQYFQYPLKTSTQSETTIFDNPYYNASVLQVSAQTPLRQDTKSESYHHLFVQEGEVEIITSQGKWPLAKGWSLFIPAACQGYDLHSTTKATVIKTTG